MRAGGHDGGVDHQPVVVGGDGDIDAVRERERGRVDVDRRGDARHPSLRRRSGDPPSRVADQEAVDREPGVVGAQRQPAQVDGDAGGAVPPRAEPIRPRREQGQAGGVAGAQGVEAARQREVLPPPLA
jgi:hypothetical protein